MEFSDNPANPADYLPPASLPYAGTSGHSGTEASRQRAEKNDKGGKTGRVQLMVQHYIEQREFWGVTIKDLRERYPEEHHGTLSGALTAMHQDGRILRLEEQRDRCSVYVGTAFHGERAIVEPAKPKKRTVIEVNPIQNYFDLGVEVFQALRDGAGEVIVRVKQ